MRLKLSAILPICLLLLPAMARAGAVYTFSTDKAPYQFSVSFEVPAIITASGWTTITNLLSASAPGSFWTGAAGCNGSPITSVQVFNPTSSSPSIAVLAGACGIDVDLTRPIDSFGTFPDGVFTTVIAQTSPTPEPESLLLCGTGILGLGAALKWKLAPNLS